MEQVIVQVPLRMDIFARLLEMQAAHTSAQLATPENLYRDVGAFVAGLLDHVVEAELGASDPGSQAVH